MIGIYKWPKGQTQSEKIHHSVVLYPIFIVFLENNFFKSSNTTQKTQIRIDKLSLGQTTVLWVSQFTRASKQYFFKSLNFRKNVSQFCVKYILREKMTLFRKIDLKINPILKLGSSFIP